MNREENYDEKNKIIQEIKIRKAIPDFEEGMVFARMYDKTAEGFFSKLLGREAYEIIAEVFVKSNNEYSYENTAFAVNGENICGMVSGYTFSMKKEFQKNILSQTTKGKKSKIRIFNFAGSILMKAMGVKHPGEYYLQAIIVNEDYQGRGLGKKLMLWIEKDAIEKGAQTLALDVSSKNKNAINLYQRQNMIVDSHWPSFPLLPSVFTRMSKNL